MLFLTTKIEISFHFEFHSFVSTSFFFFSLNLLMRHKFLKFQVPIMKGSNRIRELNIVILIESFIYVNIVPRYFLLQKLKFYSILKFILLYQPVFFLLYLNLLMRVLEVASSNNEGF